MTTPDITSTTNPRIKDAIKLRGRRHRESTSRFLIEGRVEIERAIRAGVEILDLFLDPRLGDPPAGIDKVTTVSPEAFGRLAYRRSPDGYLAIARTPAADLEALDPPGDALLLIVEAVEKPGNLGTMLRTADAAGVAAVIVCDQATDLFGPNVVRASLGCLFTVPVAIASTDAALDWCRNHQVRTVATTPEADLTYTEADLTGRTAIVVGAEHSGLSRRWLAGATDRVSVPMKGAIDSLNAATTAAVVLYEALRQRETTRHNSGARPDEGSGSLA